MLTGRAGDRSQLTKKPNLLRAPNVRLTALHDYSIRI